MVYGKVNLRSLYDKIGVNKEILVRGNNAAIDSDYTPLTPEARAKLREGIDEIYNEFVSRVAEGRKKKWDEIEPMAQGRAWLGSQAKQMDSWTSSADSIRRWSFSKRRPAYQPMSELNWYLIRPNAVFLTSI